MAYTDLSNWKKAFSPEMLEVCGLPVADEFVSERECMVQDTIAFFKTSKDAKLLHPRLDSFAKLLTYTLTDPVYLRVLLEAAATWTNDITLQRRPATAAEREKSLQQNIYALFDRYGGFLRGGKNYPFDKFEFFFLLCLLDVPTREQLKANTESSRVPLSRIEHENRQQTAEDVEAGDISDDQEDEAVGIVRTVEEIRDILDDEIDEADEHNLVAGRKLEERVRRNIQKGEVWNLLDTPTDLPNLGQVDWKKLLAHMVTQAERILPQYQTFFTQVSREKVTKILETTLEAAVKDLCSRGDFDYRG
ncbi:hypothetical protein EIK77_006065 [Talaromyces pinophilus]|nr:hypothetical protein EIK77_006065 [Talaromyces pinophilus]